MADLDDFFAKKDKKKGKQTKKFISSDELVKQLEQQPITKEEKETKEEELKVAEGNLVENEDDEWAVVEESKRVDLSNLKLGQLTLTDEGELNQNQIDRNAESFQLQRGDDSENPWRNQSGAPESTQAAAAEVPVSKPTSNVYVPPSVLKGEMMKNRKKKNLPDLQNEGQFPELGTNKPLELKSNKKDQGFEEVRHGAAFKNVQSQQAPVSVGNTYSSLLNDAESS